MSYLYNVVINLKTGRLFRYHESMGNIPEGFHIMPKTNDEYYNEHGFLRRRYFACERFHMRNKLED